VKAAATAVETSATATAVETSAATTVSATTTATMTAAKGEGRGRCRKRNCQTDSSYRSNFVHDVSLFLSLL
jgi:hypothetical protein